MSNEKEMIKENPQDKKVTSKAVQRLDRGNTDIVQGLSLDDRLKLFEIIAKGANSGINDVGQAVIVWQKAKELGLGWANAIPHMHIINGKAGIDIHIVKALLSRPGSGIRWECIEDYEPLYRYVDKDLTVYIGKSSIPNNAIIVDKLNDSVPDGKIAVVRVPEQVMENGKPVNKITPYDYRTRYVFTRKKKDIDGEYFTVTSDKGIFSWKDAIQAGLHLDRGGLESQTSAWAKYRKLMIDIRAFTLGARDIASDLLMGCYEKSELYDIEQVDYDITEDGIAEIVD